MAIEKLPHLPKQMVMACGPGYYRTSREKKRKALENFAAVVRYTLPTDEATCAYHLWHEDLHLENIFVDPTQSTKILGVTIGSLYRLRLYLSIALILPC